jgi:hypothetical protein
MSRTSSTHGRDERHKISVTKLEEKRPFGRLRRRWVDNIKVDLKETVY